MAIVYVICVRYNTPIMCALYHSYYVCVIIFLLCVSYNIPIMCAL
jgi:hypothetical protein